MAQNTPRVYHQQQIHYYRKSIAYNTAGASTGVLMGTLPAGAQITDVLFNVSTAFNAGTTNPVSVGTTATGNQVGTCNGAAAATRVTTGVALGILANDTDIYLNYIPTGGAATTGAGVAMVMYTVNNDG